jgi:type IX secretion system PorP/SprF family membrane protein
MKRWFAPVFVGLFVCCFFVSVQAQDKHFTQFYASPLTLNPALTGAFDGKFRIAGNYRDQWRNALGEPYQTFSSAIDLRFPIGLARANYKDAAAAGIVFFSDNVPSVDFVTNQLALSGAFHKALDPRSRQYLSVGFQAGIVQRSVNYEELTFSDQFNGENGYDLGSGENLPPNNFSFGDFSVGVNYSFTGKNRTALYVGGAMHHILEPSLSFYDPATDNTPENKLFRRYTAHISYEFPIAERIHLSPRAVVSLQGPHFIANAGTNIRFLIDPFAGIALHVGSWVRPVRDETDAFRMDAVVGMIGLEYNNVLLGVSYDANFTDLSLNRQGQGALEISIAYLGEYENETVICPKF